MCFYPSYCSQLRVHRVGIDASVTVVPNFSCLRLSNDLGDQNLIFYILKPPYSCVVCYIYFAKKIIFEFCFVCKMYSTWIPMVVLGNGF